MEQRRLPAYWSAVLSAGQRRTQWHRTIGRSQSGIRLPVDSRGSVRGLCYEKTLANDQHSLGACRSAVKPSERRAAADRGPFLDSRSVLLFGLLVTKPEISPPCQVDNSGESGGEGGKVKVSWFSQFTRAWRAKIRGLWRGKA